MPETVESLFAQMNARERAGMCYLLCPEDACPVALARRAFVRAAARAAARVPETQDFELDREYRFFLAQLRWTERMEARR
jgi:hypothetical protein